MRKQNNFKVLPIFLLVIIILNGCSGFLNRNPLDQISSATFWKSKSDVQKGLTACYHELLTGGDGFGAYTEELSNLSDNAYSWTNASEEQTIAKGEIQPTTGGLVSNIYSHEYHAIAICNNFLAHVSDVDLPDSASNRFIAEARFLRAYYYFHLVNFYGGVPLILKPQSYESNPKNYKSRATKKQVINQILKDLNFAIKHLPAKRYSGHAVRGSALGIKARVLLSVDRWSDAAAAADSVIKSGIFHLAKSYSGLFLKPTQNNNPEIMFSAKYKLPNQYSDLDYRIGWDQWERVQPLQDLVSAYEMKNGKPINALNSGYDPNHPYKNRDPRLMMTIIVPGESWAYSSNGIFDPQKDGHNRTGYLMEKYIDNSRAPASYNTRSDQDFVFLRYAGILLMYAEAKNEASGPDPSVYSAINDIPARVNMPPLPKGLSKAEMRKRIRNERRVELALEGLRYFDLKRWKIAEKVMPQVDVPGAKRKFRKNNYVWPIPQNVIDINSNIKQNPGY
jgi:hypothetical protein